MSHGDTGPLHILFHLTLYYICTGQVSSIESVIKKSVTQIYCKSYELVLESKVIALSNVGGLIRLVL
jgi:hypothetical protein